MFNICPNCGHYHVDKVVTHTPEGSFATCPACEFDVPFVSLPLFCLTGPSGVGKGTLLKRLRLQHPDLYLSISATTRQPRPGEVDGQHYYLLDRTAFEAMAAEGDLLEWAEYAGNYYGTPRKPVEAQIQAGCTVILEIELEGARQVRNTLPTAQQIFVLPPSLEELETRIRQRGQDADAPTPRRWAPPRVKTAAAE